MPDEEAYLAHITTGSHREQICNFLLTQLDLSSQAQFEFVIRVCHESSLLSDARRKLCAVTREQRKDKNYGDRLRKYLLRSGLKWQAVRS